LPAKHVRQQPPQDRRLRQQELDNEALEASDALEEVEKEKPKIKNNLSGKSSNKNQNRVQEQLKGAELDVDTKNRCSGCLGDTTGADNLCDICGRCVIKNNY
jgi:hypothetical protein